VLGALTITSVKNDLAKGRIAVLSTLLWRMDSSTACAKQVRSPAAAGEQCAVRRYVAMGPLMWPAQNCPFPWDLDPT